MAFTGTVAVSGRGKGIVVETGTRTVLGQIAEEVRDVSAVKTPLHDRLERFARLLVYVVLGFAAMVFVAGALLGRSATEMFLVAVATAVSAVPEGLPVAVTIAMAIGVSRMARRNAIVRQLPAVETLGSTTVIGSDKTGTLTKNEMTVRLVHDGEHLYEVTGSGYEPGGEVLHEGLPPKAEEQARIDAIMRIGLLCNEASIYVEDDTYRVDGDPTEGALIVAAMKAGMMPEEMKDGYPQVAIVPFESDRGYMATLNRHRGRMLLLLKGAPEKVVEMCSGTTSGRDLNSKEVLHAAGSLASEGLRVLAMAEKEMPPEAEDISHKDLHEGMRFAGLVGMMDPPRPEAVDAVAGCRRAGINTVMITGDHAVTAKAIARRIGIGGDEPGVLEGREIEAISDEELFKRVGSTSVYARVSPQHKLRITQRLQEHGEIVAVTGDGVNDAPALKAAHIGVAMGKSGTDVAKEASDMVLADDNFASIFAAVEEGRVVYDNIKKVTLFLVSCGLGELLAIMATLVMGLPIPYIPAQILWLNLVTNGFQDVALAFEPGEAGVLRRKPRPPKEGILSSFMVQRTFLMGITMAVGTVAMFVIELRGGASIERARTVALTTMVFFQFYQAFNCRSETESVFTKPLTSNPFLMVSMIAAFFAQLAVLYVPSLQWVFRTVPLTVVEWTEIGFVTISIMVAVEVDKWIRRRGRMASEAA
jgi:Ca2+-transporting ATPase